MQQVWWFIAKRYFLTRNKRNFIHLLSGISLLGVAVGTAALIIVLSAFNGMRDVAREMYQSFDPTLRVVPATGKWLYKTDSLANVIQQVKGVESVADALEDNVLLHYVNSQAIVKLKAIKPYPQYQKRLQTHLLAGKSNLLEGSQQMGILGVGLVQALGIDPSAGIDKVELWYPKRNAKVSVNPERAFQKSSVRIGGAFAIEQGYDNQYLIVPIAIGEELMQAGDRRSYLEIAIKPGVSVSAVKSELQDILANNLLVQDTDDQHADLIKILKLEKLFVFVALSFILLIASFNIFVSLSMLVLDKKHDLSILKAMGADEGTVSRVFVSVGAMIALGGAIIGMGIGVLVCLLQQQYGFVSMGITNALVDAYPVTLEWADVLAVGLAVIIITVLSSWSPAKRAAEVPALPNLIG